MSCPYALLVSTLSAPLRSEFDSQCLSNIVIFALNRIYHIFFHMINFALHFQEKYNNVVNKNLEHKKTYIENIIYKQPQMHSNRAHHKAFACERN